VIASFKSKALERYWTNNDASRIRPDWLRRVGLILSRMDAAQTPDEMDLPGLGFHSLSGDLAGRYSVSVSRNWRITFGWKGENAIAVALEDYHGH
jgi:proteic killer suppression protein